MKAGRLLTGAVRIAEWDLGEDSLAEWVRERIQAPAVSL
jgi:hypothetical protein